MARIPAVPEEQAGVLGRLAYRVVILPGVDRVPPATMRTLEAFARAGGIIVATRRIPDSAPGLRATAREGTELREAAARLFGPASPGHVIADERDGLARLLRGSLRPDVRFTPAAPDVGFVHRRLPFADVYFVANTSNVTVRTSAAFRVGRRGAESWDPMTGAVSALVADVRDADQVALPFTLEP